MTRLLLTLCVALSVPGVALAATARKHLAEDRRELKDDLRDAAQAKRLLRDYDRAARSGSRRALATAEARVARAIDAECREAKEEAGEASHRLQEDAPKQGWHPSQDPIDERGDRYADDRRRVVDRKDLILEADYRRRMAGLRDEWASLRGHRKAKDMKRKHAIVEELVRLSRTEIRRDVQEIKEDRQNVQEEKHD